MGRLLNYMNFLAYALNILVTYLVGNTHLVGLTNAEVSGKYPALYTPSGWAFSIWGLIFMLEACFAIYQLLPTVRDSEAVQRGVGPYWILMVLCQAAWSFAFAKQSIPFSMACMLGIFLSLFALWSSLRSVLRKGPVTWAQFLCLSLPFSLNFGWITAATLANANIVAVYRDASNWEQQLAVCVASFVVLGIAAVATSGRLNAESADGAYCLVLVWAAAAISTNLKNPNSSAIKMFPSYVTGGLSSAAGALSVFAGLCAVSALFTRRARNTTATNTGDEYGTIQPTAPPKPAGRGGEALLHT